MVLQREGHPLHIRLLIRVLLLKADLSYLQNHQPLLTKPPTGWLFHLKVTMFANLLDTFKKPPAKVLAQDDLEEAHRQYLKHTAAAAYHAKISEYYSDSIQRLGMYIKKA